MLLVIVEVLADLLESETAGRNVSQYLVLAPTGLRTDRHSRDVLKAADAADGFSKPVWDGVRLVNR